MQISRNHTGHRIGECHQKANLTSAQVAEMRRLHEDEQIKMGYTKLARLFGCGRSTARDICTYRTRWNG